MSLNEKVRILKQRFPYFDILRSLNDSNVDSIYIEAPNGAYLEVPYVTDLEDIISQAKDLLDELI